MSMITIIGRGHSGTRAMSHTLSQSGVYMGANLNKSGDLIPPEDMYEACRIMAKYVEYKGGLNWDFSRLHTMKIDPLFIKHLELFLDSVIKSDAIHKGWKIPETTLVYPWIIRLFPDIKYIFWVRDPRDSILGAHLTDDLEDFGIKYDKSDNVYVNRSISWLYQRAIVKAVPPPKNKIYVRFEDFVLKQDEVLKHLEDFLGFNLAKIPVRNDSVGRWRIQGCPVDMSFFKDELIELNYSTDFSK